MRDEQDDNQKPATVKAPIPSYDEALSTLEAFQNGSYGLQSTDNVAQHRLAAGYSLFDDPWLGSDEEELDS